VYPPALRRYYVKLRLPVVSQPAFESERGSVTVLDAAPRPILQGLSVKRVVLEPGTIREPQWNVNANQLAHCTAGPVLASILGNADAFSFSPRPQSADASSCTS
jgi:oxalate decarboxylase